MRLHSLRSVWTPDLEGNLGIQTSQKKKKSGQAKKLGPSSQTVPVRTNLLVLTPPTSIRGYSEVARRGGQPRDPGRSWVFPRFPDRRPWTLPTFHPKWHRGKAPRESCPLAQGGTFWGHCPPYSSRIAENPAPCPPRKPLTSHRGLSRASWQGTDKG